MCNKRAMNVFWVRGEGEVEDDGLFDKEMWETENWIVYLL